MRSQAMFEVALQPTVVDLDHQLEEMIWRVVSRHAELRDTVPAVSSVTAYSVFDGLFENSLIRHLAGDTGATERLRTESAWLISTLMKA